MNRRGFLGAVLAVSVAALTGLQVSQRKLVASGYSLYGRIRGRHYDHMILDDLVSEEHVVSRTAWEARFPGSHPIDPELIRRYEMALAKQDIKNMLTHRVSF